MKSIQVMLALLVMMAAVGCEDSADNTPGMPDTAPSIRGEVTAATMQSIRVEENPAEASGSAKADVRLTANTVVLRQDGSVTDASELRKGQVVRVWFTGPVAESYPVLANGGTILIERGDIVQVKERHEARLMAIPGVVGVGIGQRDGRVCIVVMVETRTPQIDDQVPDTLDGFPVLIEVTGPIVAQ